jgi:hypothetical protein
MSERIATRRSFLKNATACAAGAVAASCQRLREAAPTPAKVVPPSERVTLAHIGTGNMGGGHVGGFLRLKDAQIVALCDPFKSRRDEKAEMVATHYAREKNRGSYKACATYNDFRELLARDDIDAVVIATPDHWHVPIAIAAARAGKGMYVEKPLGVSVEQNRALGEAIKRHGNVFQYGTQQRSGRNFRFACELARNRRIGKLHTIHVWCARGERGGSTEPIPVPKGFDYDMWLGPAPVAPYTEDRCITGGTARKGAYHIYDYSLGFIAGWGAHPLDIAQWGNDTDTTSPIEYEGTGTIPTEGLFDTITTWDMHCLYANGVKMRFMSDDVAKPFVERYHPKFIDHGTTFVGSEGWVSVDRQGIYADPPSLLESETGPAEIHLYESRDHRQNFLDCVKNRTATVSPIEAAIRSDTISHLCDIAIRVGRKITWDPEREIIVGDEEASRMLTRAMRSPWHL